MPIIFLLIPLLGIFALNLPPRSLSRRVSPWLVGAICVVQFGLAATAQMAFWQSVELPLPSLLSGRLSVDLITQVMLCTIAMVTLAANAVGFDGEDRKIVLARSLMLVLVIGMDGIVLLRDLFTIYIFLEITAVACFVLIAIDRKAEALGGAYKYFILSGLATFALIVANALVFMRTGSLTFESVNNAFQAHDTVVSAALVLYVVAFCVKAGVAPFHGWLPDAHGSAPNAVSVLLSGVVIKAGGAYLALRMVSEVFVKQVASSTYELTGSLSGDLTGMLSLEPISGLSGGVSLEPISNLAAIPVGLPTLAGQVFMALGAFSIVVGAFAAMSQPDMKRVLAFSSVSQMGYIIMAAGLSTRLAVIGALIHIINHALFKSLLFVNAASVKEQTGTVELAKLGGLAEKMPVTGWTSVIGMLSAAGIPPLSGFWSKLLILIALVNAGQWAYACIALLMSVATLGYFLILQRKVFFGQLREGLEQLRESRPSLMATSLALSLATVFLGLLFPLVLLAMQNFGMLL